VRWSAFVAAVVLAALPFGVSAQTAPGGDDPQDPLPKPVFSITVVDTTPLPGVELPVDSIPAPVQFALEDELDRRGAIELPNALNRQMNGVFVNDIQGNPFQPDLSYRGYSASPLLGTPQGLSVYMDGVRLNQPFGDIVSWDLIPGVALESAALMPGSNPLFGLNTLGGAIVIRTKDGTRMEGTHVRGLYGNDARVDVELEHGGRSAGGFHWYVAGYLFGEDGWRQESPTDVRQLFGKIGRRSATHDMSLTLAYADNELGGNGLQEIGFLDRDYASVYTKPDITDNRATFVNLAVRREHGERLAVSGNVYYRNIRSATFNGDINEESLDQAVYQPTPEEQAALADAGSTGFPTEGATAANTPWPSWRCIANVLLNDEPAELCNGLINRTATDQWNAGASAQIAWRHGRGSVDNHLTAGAAYDRGRVTFIQSTELGYLVPGRSVAGLGAFGDGGITGGEIDGQPFDARAGLDGLIHTWSAYATDTLTLARRWHLTTSARYNETRISNRDRIDPGGGPGSLDGDHVFRRLNPAVGLTVSATPAVNLYVGYMEGSRAATSIELGCADPESPCRLPNALAGDPPLDQVVTRTWETGIRGRTKDVNWHFGAFRADNDDDILFVTSGLTGLGYFRNFGRTRRQGVELGLKGRFAGVRAGVGYTYLDATYRTRETVNGQGNSTNETAMSGLPGVEGSITIEPGSRIPLIPEHTVKAYASVGLTSAIELDVGVIAASGVVARGNENNRHQPDGTYYLGTGRTSAYGVVNLGVRGRLARWLSLRLQIDNLLDQRYSTAAELGPTGFTEQGTYVARPLPPIGAEYPVRQSTFFAPGAPRRAWIGTELVF
jgi:outer membrane receptor protein involved in Fe transport